MPDVSKDKSSRDLDVSPAVNNHASLIVGYWFSDLQQNFPLNTSRKLFAYVPPWFVSILLQNVLAQMGHQVVVSHFVRASYMALASPAVKLETLKKIYWKMLRKLEKILQNEEIPY